MSTKLEELSDIDEQEYEGEDVYEDTNDYPENNTQEEYPQENFEDPSTRQISYSIYQHIKEPILASLLVLILSNNSFLEIMAKIPYVKNIPSSIFAAVMMGILFFIIRIFI